MIREKTRPVPKQIFNEQINNNGYDSLSSSSLEQPSDKRIIELDNTNINLSRDRPDAIN